MAGASGTFVNLAPRLTFGLPDLASFMPVSLPDSLMTSVSGFRGRVGNPFTPELGAALGAAYGAFLQEEGDGSLVLVGRDSRTSGPMLQRAVVAGLISVGCQVTELGVAPTPSVLMAVADAAAAGGVVVTASHNPAQWNALKFAVGAGTFLPAKRMARFVAFLTTREPRRAQWDALHAPTCDDGAAARHLERVLTLPYVEPERIRAAGIRVALDCVNGAGGVVVPELLERLGCSVHAVGTEPNGRFPRDPEPTAANLEDLCRLTVGSGADIGLAVDPDGDRLSLVDEKGRALGEDVTLALAADVVLRRRRGTTVANLSTSRIVEDVAARHDCPMVRAPVGEINVASRMIDENAVIGGEGNGGVIVPALHHTRDAVAGAALVLQYLVDERPAEAPDDADRLPLSARVAALPKYRIVKRKLTFPEDVDMDAAYAALERELPPGDVDRSDGLHIAWSERRSWLHIRPSGTEPVVRIVAEAPADAAEDDVPAALHLMRSAGRTIERASRQGR